MHSDQLVKELVAVPEIAPAFSLSADQQEAKDRILKWLEGPDQEFRLGGYAGTGKSTVIKDILESVKMPTGVGAFTGKAVSVLRKKDIFRAVTLHRMLYDMVVVNGKRTFVPKSWLPYNLVIVDEASMVSQELYDQLKKHRIKILFIGDPGQLEPVGANPNLMRKCDFVLKTIHRQAKGNPILKLADGVRKKKVKHEDIEWGELVGPDGSKLNILESIYDVDLTSFDVALCAKNVTRHGINERYRALLNQYGQPIVGDEVICLKNDRKLGIFNGMSMKIEHIGKTFGKEHTGFFADLIDDDGERFESIPVLDKYFGKDFKQNDESHNGIPFDFGFCLTAWKAQGSSWEDILVIDEPLYKTDWARWFYTNLTRTEKDCTIVIS
jgi:exodeoxyribonuclease-5